MATAQTTSKPGNVTKLLLQRIRLDAGTQTRAHIDEATVTEYAEAMVRGDRFPPVVVFQQNGQIILADGFHRVKAARRAKFKHIAAEVQQGGRTEALRFALGANHKHGLRRTNADKRRAVEMAIAEFVNLSDRLLAEMCGVSQPFVSNLRDQLITVISSKPRLGKDGKLRRKPGASVTLCESNREGRTGFRAVLADPPWPFDSPRALVGNAGRGSENGRAAAITQVGVLAHYKVMSIEEIKALPVAKHVEQDAHLYLWTTNSFMVEAHEVARAWGFEPKTIITWVKTQKDNPTQPSMKTGFWYRSATEHLLFAVRGTMRLCGPPAPTAVLSPRLPHSVKPLWCYELIEQQSTGPYLELFARRIRAGWDAWGDQIQSTFLLWSGRPVVREEDD